MSGIWDGAREDFGDWPGDLEARIREVSGGPIRKPAMTRAQWFSAVYRGRSRPRRLWRRYGPVLLIGLAAGMWAGCVLRAVLG